MYYRRLIALLIVCAYLILPLDCFANLEHPFAADSPQAGGSLQGGGSLYDGSSLESGTLLLTASPGEPASHCPCSDRHGSDGCNPSCSCCSCCSFFAPPPTAIVWRALQPSTSFSMLEPFKHFPEVYLPIFVPPQNQS